MALKNLFNRHFIDTYRDLPRHQITSEPPQSFVFLFVVSIGACCLSHFQIHLTTSKHFVSTFSFIETFSDTETLNFVYVMFETVPLLFEKTPFLPISFSQTQYASVFQKQKRKLCKIANCSSFASELWKRNSFVFKNLFIFKCL